MAMVDTSPICIDYLYQSTSKKLRRIIQLHIFIIGSRVPAGTLAKTAAYTALDKHHHIDVSEQFEIYAYMFQHSVRKI